MVPKRFLNDFFLIYIINFRFQIVVLLVGSKNKDVTSVMDILRNVPCILCTEENNMERIKTGPILHTLIRGYKQKGKLYRRTLLLLQLHMPNED